MQRLRVHYAKRGRLRFASHRDFARAFERAVRRAGVPIAFSAGFSPHPKVSYANAAPTGVASEAEYLEIGVVERCDPERVRAALDASLPPGLDILEVVEAGPGSLADRLEASRWRVVLPGLSAAVVGDAVAAFLGRDEVVVERLTKNGVRSFDARSAVLAADGRGRGHRGRCAGAPGLGATPGAGPCAILHVVVRHATPAVRPDDVLEALHRVADLAPPVPVQVTRLAQGPHDGVTGEIDDPLAPDRG